MPKTPKVFQKKSKVKTWKEGHISWECRGEWRNQGRRGNGGSGGRQMAKSLAVMQEVLKKLASDAVFP